MKKVNGKYIRLTEKQLNQLIKEQVDKSVNKILQEYANPRKEVIKNLKNYFEQLIQNWCLVHYCTLVNEDINNCKHHWKNELWAILGKMGSFKLQGNNSYGSRIKAIETAENGEELLSDVDVVYGNVRAKFAKENINNEEIICNVIDDLVKSKNDIIHVIANFDKNEIIEYINKI